MILEEFIEIKWHSRTKNFYVNKGYIFTKVGNLFLLKVSDLMLGSTIKIHVKCDICGNEKLLSYCFYNINFFHLD